MPVTSGDLRVVGPSRSGLADLDTAERSLPASTYSNDSSGTETARRCCCSGLRRRMDERERKLAPERNESAGDECVGSVSVTIGPA